MQTTTHQFPIIPLRHTLLAALLVTGFGTAHAGNITLGTGATVWESDRTIVIGEQASITYSDGTIVIGEQTWADQSARSVLLASRSATSIPVWMLNSPDSVALMTGGGVLASSTQSVAIGYGTTVVGSVFGLVGNAAIGWRSTIRGTAQYATALGPGATVDARDTGSVIAGGLAVGRDALVSGISPSSSALGAGSVVTDAAYATAIGGGSVSADSGVAIGYGASVIPATASAGTGSVALGAHSYADSADQVSVGNALTGLTRRVSNVSDGMLESDAVTVRQLNAAIAGAGIIGGVDQAALDVVTAQADVAATAAAAAQSTADQALVSAGTAHTTATAALATANTAISEIDPLKTRMTSAEGRLTTLEGKVEDLDKRLADTESRLSGGIAIAMAMSQPAVIGPQARNALIAGTATYNGAAAVGVQYSRLLDTPATRNVVLSAGGGVSSGGQYAVRAGASLSW